MSYSLSETVEAYQRSLEEGKIYPTGYPWLDDALGGGVLCHDMLVVGALDNVGKSRWCLSSCFFRAQMKQHSLYISVEDSPRKVGKRATRALRDFPDTDKYVVCEFHPTSTESVCHTIRTTRPEVSMVYVDYIQDLDELDNKVIARNLRAIKQAVSERDSGLVIASQVTERRDANGQLLFPPTRFWLRGARELSQKADSVVMMWPGEGRTVNAVVDKNKDGDVGVRAVLQPAYGATLLNRGQLVANEQPEDEPWE